MVNGEQDMIERALARLSEIDAEIAPQEAERRRLRAFVNQACVFAGREQLFPDENAPSNSAAPTPAIQRPQAAPLRVAPSAVFRSLQIEPDQFFGQGLATAARLYLEARKASIGTGPASADDIYEALIQGGFQFPSRDPENRKRGLQVSLSKNTAVFRKLPNDMYGLAEWYPGQTATQAKASAPKKRRKKGKAKGVKPTGRPRGRPRKVHAETSGTAAPPEVASE